MGEVRRWLIDFIATTPAMSVLVRELDITQASSSLEKLSPALDNECTERSAKDSDTPHTVLICSDHCTAGVKARVVIPTLHMSPASRPALSP